MSCRGPAVLRISPGDSKRSTKRRPPSFDPCDTRAHASIDRRYYRSRARRDAMADLIAAPRFRLRPARSDNRRTACAEGTPPPGLRGLRSGSLLRNFHAPRLCTHRFEWRVWLRKRVQHTIPSSTTVVAHILDVTRPVFLVSRDGTKAIHKHFVAVTMGCTRGRTVGRTNSRIFYGVYPFLIHGIDLGSYIRVLRC
jgi:hypothetical protein